MNFTTRPELIGTFGAVTSTHWLGSAVGMSILESGGNAFDAAVATGFTLQVVEPHLNGPGGDLPAIFYSVREDKVRVLCAQGPAPAAANIEHFRSLDLDTVPGSGLLPAVIPGAFCGWMQLLKDFGTKRLREVLEPAIYYARTGYPIVPNIANTIGKVSKLFQTEWTTSGEIYLNNGQVPEIGSLHRNEKLAETYRRLVEEAEKSSADREGQIEAALKLWREGYVATAIDEFFQSNEILDPSGRRHSGLLTG
ncbi:MAG: gamma-glutamyltransferase, partial [Methyloligellaceae bacterium]